MSDTLLLTIPGAEDENGAEYDLRVYEDAEDALVFERGPDTRRRACGEEAVLVREITRWADWAEKRRAALAEHNRAVRAEERGRIRLELETEARRLLAQLEGQTDYANNYIAADALRDFARRLEPKP